MGCGASRDNEEGLHKPLNSHMERIGVESIDTIFDKAGDIIHSLEEIRDAVIDERDDLVASSGACCHVKPDFFLCFRSFMWKLSADHKGDVLKADIDLHHNEPYLKLDSSKNTAESIKISHDLVTYVKGIISLYERAEEVKTAIEGVGNEVVEGAPQFIDQIGDKFKGDLLAAPGAIKKLNRNKDKVTKAVNAAPKILEELKNSLAQFKTLAEFTKNVDEIEKVNEVGKAANKANHTAAIDIVWNNLPQTERYGASAKDGYNLVKKRKDNKSKTKGEKKKE